MAERIDLGERGSYHTGNKINDLTSKEWLKFTKSWFVHNPKRRSSTEILHPAKYPESMVEEFVSFFTKSGGVVLDPFLGTGSTLVACQATGRNGIGVELQEKYAKIATSRVDSSQHVIIGNSSRLSEMNIPPVDFVITSPPYGNMLTKKGLAQDKRGDLDTQYSESSDDLGNMEYDAFIGALVDVFLQCKSVMTDGAHLVVIIQNFMHGAVYQPLAWDVGRALSEHFTFRGERLWLQDNKTLYPYGYRYSYVPNVHHHYCLIFRK